jgi:hypothetical protein
MLYNLGYFINRVRLNNTNRITYSAILKKRDTRTKLDCFSLLC